MASKLTAYKKLLREANVKGDTEAAESYTRKIDKLEAAEKAAEAAAIAQEGLMQNNSRGSAPKVMKKRKQEKPSSAALSAAAVAAAAAAAAAAVDDDDFASVAGAALQQAVVDPNVSALGHQHDHHHIPLDSQLDPNFSASLKDEENELIKYMEAGQNVGPPVAAVLTSNGRRAAAPRSFAGQDDEIEGDEDDAVIDEDDEDDEEEVFEDNAKKAPKRAKNVPPEGITKLAQVESCCGRIYKRRKNPIQWCDWMAGWTLLQPLTKSSARGPFVPPNHDSAEAYNAYFRDAFYKFGVFCEADIAQLLDGTCKANGRTLDEVCLAVKNRLGGDRSLTYTLLNVGSFDTISFNLWRTDRGDFLYFKRKAEYPRFHSSQIERAELGGRYMEELLKWITIMREQILYRGPQKVPDSILNHNIFEKLLPNEVPNNGDLPIMSAFSTSQDKDSPFLLETMYRKRDSGYYLKMIPSIVSYYTLNISTLAFLDRYQDILDILGWDPARYLVHFIVFMRLVEKISSITFVILAVLPDTSENDVLVSATLEALPAIRDSILFFIEHADANAAERAILLLFELAFTEQLKIKTKSELVLFNTIKSRWPQYDAKAGAAMVLKFGKFKPTELNLKPILQGWSTK